MKKLYAFLLPALATLSGSAQLNFSGPLTARQEPGLSKVMMFNETLSLSFLRSSFDTAGGKINNAAFNAYLYEEASRENNDRSNNIKATRVDETGDRLSAVPCTPPIGQATGLLFGVLSSISQPGSFTAAAAGGASGYLVVRSIGSLSATPVNGTSYAAGNALGNGVVVQSSSALSFTATSLAGNTPYTYTVFSYNSGTCTDGPAYNTVLPLTGTAVSCPAAPSLPTTPVITATGFQLSWTSSKGGGAAPVSYNLEIATSPTFAQVVSGSPFTINDTTTVQPLMSYTVSGLSAASTYYYRLKANGCNTTSVSGSVATACNAVSLPYTQGFNSSSLPVCWRTAIAAVQTDTKISFVTQGSNPSTNPSGVGSHFVQYNAYNSATGAAGSEERLIAAPVSTVGISSVDVEFFWRNENNPTYSTGAYLNEGVQVQYSTDYGATWVNAGNLFPRHDPTLAAGTAAWNKKILTLPPAASNQPVLLVAFKFHSEYGDNMFLDAVTIEATPGCYAPTINPITNVAYNSARVNWTVAVQTPAGYEVYYSTSNTAPTGSTTASVSAITNTYYDITGLSPSTTYYAWVRSNCGGNGKSIWTLSASFTTLCAPVNVPYTENFDAVTTPALPTCTANEDANGDNISWATVTAPTGYTGKVLQYSFNPASSASDWFYTAGVNLTAGTSYTLTFKYGNNYSTTFEKMKVYYGNGQSSTAMTTLLQDFPFISNSTVNTAVITFTPSSTGVYYFGFYAYSDANQYNLYLDDISVGLTPSVPPNDEAMGALTLTVGSGCTGANYTLAGATKSANEVYPSCSGTGQAPVWFKFVATSTTVRISTDVGTGNTLADSKIALFAATNPADYSTFTILACDDNGGTTLSGGNMSVLYATGLTVGATYYIAVDKSTSTVTSGTFCITVDNLSSTMLATTSQCNSNFQQPTGNNTNYTGWVPLLGDNGTLIALVKANAGDPVSSYTAALTVSPTQRQYAGKFYLNRNYLIGNATTKTVNVQLFFLNTELASLNTANGTTLGNIGATRQTGVPCQTNFTPGVGSSSFLSQMSSGTSNDVSWIELNAPPGVSNLFLNKTGTVLPANLLSFSGSRQGTNNVLKWTVAQEQDMQAYEVERSTNNVDWVLAGRVTGVSNTTAQHDYSFTDNHVNGQRQYYRLRLVSIGGEMKLSNTILISGAKIAALTISSLYPNPTLSNVNLLIDAPQRDGVTVTVTDATGRVVQVKRTTIDVGANTLTINVSALAQGTYLIKLSSDTGQTTTAKFAKE